MSDPFDTQSSSYRPGVWPKKLPVLRSTGLEWPAPASDATLLDPIRAIDRDALPNWIDRLRDAGVNANRRACPDLQGQLFQSLRRPIDTILVDLLDGESPLCLNSTLAARYPMELLAGSTLLSRLTGARVWQVVDNRCPSAWIGNFRAVSKLLGHRVSPLVNDYPQADPTLLLYTILNRRLRPDRLPTEQATILIDAPAAIAIGHVALYDRRMDAVPLAIRDHVQERLLLTLADVGASLGDAMTSAGATRNPLAILRRGDLLRDQRSNRDVKVDVGEFVVHLCPPEEPINPDPCIRCGWCYEACPTRVQPANVLEAAQRGDPTLADAAGIDACIECGICAYVCPSRLPLLEGIRLMKRPHTDA